MTPDQAVALARSMREAGAVRFTLKGDSLSCVLRPPDPTPDEEIRSRIAEFTPEERLKLAADAKKDLEADLYGASK